MDFDLFQIEELKYSFILLMIVKSLASRLLNKQTLFNFAKSKVKESEPVAQLRKGQISQVSSIYKRGYWCRG